MVKLSEKIENLKKIKMYFSKGFGQESSVGSASINKLKYFNVLNNNDEEICSMVNVSFINFIDNVINKDTRSVIRSTNIAKLSLMEKTDDGWGV